MKTIHVTATELKHNIAEILNKVHYHKATALIKRHDKVVAKLVPVDNKKRKNKEALIDKYFGILPDFPDVTKFRYFRKRKIAV